MSPFNEIPRIGKSTETESRLVVYFRLVGKRNGRSMPMSTGLLLEMLKMFWN